MNVNLSYKGFTGSVEFSKEDNVFFGQIKDINGFVNYEADSEQELPEAFHQAVDDYITYCEENKIVPHKK